MMMKQFCKFLSSKARPLPLFSVSGRAQFATKVAVGDLKKGDVVFIKDKISEIVELSTSGKGRGSRSIQITYRTMDNASSKGSVKSADGELFLVPDLKSKKVQYLYSDEEGFHCVTPSSEEYVISKSFFSPEILSLLEEQNVFRINVNEENDEVLGVHVADSIVCEVDAFHLDSDSNRKIVTVKCGAKIQVPSHINVGDFISVHTKTLKFLERIDASNVENQSSRKLAD